MLFDHALSIAIDDILPRIGCRFIIADVKRSAIDFYYKKGMALINTCDNYQAERPVMFLDLAGALKNLRFKFTLSSSVPRAIARAGC